MEDGICIESNGSADPWECMSDAFVVRFGKLILPEFEDRLSDDRSVDEQEDGVGGSI